MKKNYIKIIMFVIFLTIPAFAFAKLEYRTLTSLPGVYEKGQSVDLEKFIPRIFYFILGLGITWSFLLLVYQGFLYATKGLNPSAKTDIKDKIWSTLKGLFFILVSYAIIYEINPNSLNLNLKIIKPNIQRAADLVFVGWGDSEEDVRKSLTNGGISINHDNPCIGAQTQGCTSVGGMPKSAIDGLIQLKKDCSGCFVQVTGGTEGGHQTHAVGRGQVDLKPSDDLNKFLGKPTPQNNDKVTKKINGKDVIFVYEVIGANGTATGNHWHVQF